jgi:hypothetical protein
MGILKLEESLRLLGMILCVEPEKIRAGMASTVDFDTPTLPSGLCGPDITFGDLK